jgi:hypothetical protein
MGDLSRHSVQSSDDVSIFDQDVCLNAGSCGKALFTFGKEFGNQA